MARKLYFTVLGVGLLIAPLDVRAVEYNEPSPDVIEEQAPPPTALEAWNATGFRLQLRFGWERLVAANLDAPEMTAYGLDIEPGVRISRRWSLGLGLRYSVVYGSWRGLRWNTTMDLAAHPFGGALIALGAGYGGFQGNKRLQKGELRRYVMVDGQKRPAPTGLIDCEGDGAVILGRVGYLFAVGELFSTGPVLQADVQATPCEGNARVNGHWARVPELWWHKSLQASWSLSWR